MSLISIQRFSPSACFSFATKLKINHCNLKFALLPKSQPILFECALVFVFARGVGQQSLSTIIHIS